MQTILALLLVTASSMMLGVMSILRKGYQITNRAGMPETMFFTLFISVLGFCMGSIANGGIQIDATSLVFAGVYAVISTVTASICIYATKFGSVSTLLLWAMLGSLVLPSVFGLLTQPDTNRITIYKLFGFAMALICMIINFAVDKSRQKSDVRFKLLCAVVFFTNGSALIVFNLKNRFCENFPNMAFVAEYMAVSAVLTFLCLAVMSLKNKKVWISVKSTVNKRSVFLMLTYAALFFLSECLALKCSGMIPLIMQAPITFCIPILTTAGIDYVVYKEKLNKVSLWQMIFACLCCISFIME